jgi:hypothetical protein
MVSVRITMACIVEVIESGTIIHDRCDVLLSATGVLKYSLTQTKCEKPLLTIDSSNWKWPAIEGLSDFKGKILHSARWDASYDFTDKVVAVIGAGSSAIQIVPALTSSSPRLLAPEIGC